MKVKKKIIVRIMLFLLLVSGVRFSQAQEGLMPLMPQQDSAQMELERKLLYQQLISGTLENGEMLQLTEIPKFDFNTIIAQRYSFNPSDLRLQTSSYSGILPGTYLFAPTPFLRNGSIFSSASYQLNDNFTLGGYSFGANSIFSAPLPNQGMNNFDTRGSTLFMQYKVSKNFKIETRVSVTQGPGGY